MTTAFTAKPNGKRIAYYRCSTTYKKSWSECPVKHVSAGSIVPGLRANWVPVP